MSFNGVKNSFNNKNTISNVNMTKRIKLKPINLINNYQFDKKDNNNKLDKQNNNNSIKNKNIKNKRLNKIILRNNNSLLYNINKNKSNKNNFEKNYLTNINTNNYNIDNKNKFYSSLNNQILSNKNKLNNFSNNAKFLRNSRAKSNISINKNKLSSDNLSLSNESKNEKEKNNIKINKIKKKILSSKAKSSHNIFISNLNIRDDLNSGKERKINEKKYRKKWDLPKVINFDKITGRYKENKNPIKHHVCERAYDYSPNYELILFNDKKAYVKMGKDNKNKFKNYKINITRKYLCNHINIINNSGNFYNILKILKEEKEKKDKQKEKLEKKFNILEVYNYLFKNNQYFMINTGKIK